jgi:hypothetical protein
LKRQNRRIRNEDVRISDRVGGGESERRRDQVLGIDDGIVRFHEALSRTQRSLTTEVPGEVEQDERKVVLVLEDLRVLDHSRLGDRDRARQCGNQGAWH